MVSFRSSFRVFSPGFVVPFRVPLCEFVVSGLRRFGTGTTNSHETPRKRKLLTGLATVALLAPVFTMTASPRRTITTLQRSSASPRLHLPASQKLEPSEKSWKQAEKHLKK